MIQKLTFRARKQPRQRLQRIPIPQLAGRLLRHQNKIMFQQRCSLRYSVFFCFLRGYGPHGDDQASFDAEDGVGGYVVVRGDVEGAVCLQVSSRARVCLNWSDSGVVGKDGMR